MQKGISLTLASYYARLEARCQDYTSLLLVSLIPSLYIECSGLH